MHVSATASSLLRHRLGGVLAAAAILLPAAAHAQLRPGTGAAPRGPSLSAPAPTPEAPAAASAPSTTEMENAGRVTAHAWLLVLDRQDWGTAWDAASAVFKQSVPLGNWMDNVPKVRSPLGAFVEREPVEVVYRSTLPGRPSGHYVTVAFDSRFAQKPVREVVTTVREDDGRWRVMGYTYSDR